MQRFFILILIQGFLIALIISTDLLNIYDKNYSQQMQIDEYFNNISLKYYGTEKHGQELAIINQTMKLKAGSTQEDIIIPSLNALLHFYETYEMSSVDKELKKDIPEQIVESSSQNPNQIELFISSIAPPFVGIIIILAVICGYLLGRWKSKREFKLEKSNNTLNNTRDLSTIYNKDELLINYKEKK